MTVLGWIAIVSGLMVVGISWWKRLHWRKKTAAVPGASVCYWTMKQASEREQIKRISDRLERIKRRPF